MQSYKLYVSFKNNMWLVCTMDSQKKTDLTGSLGHSKFWPGMRSQRAHDIPVVPLLYVIVLQEMSPLYSIPIVSAW